MKPALLVGARFQSFESHYSTTLFCETVATPGTTQLHLDAIAGRRKLPRLSVAFRSQIRQAMPQRFVSLRGRSGLAEAQLRVPEIRRGLQRGRCVCGSALRDKAFVFF